MKKWLILIALASCSGGKPNGGDGDLLAEVYDKQLTLEQVLPLIPEGLNPEDSTEFVKQFVDGWIRDMVIVHQAEENLPEETRNVEARLENYKRSLLVYEYEKEFARQKLDTLVSEEEIEKHYKENQDEFKLADYIVKVLYVKLDKTVKGREKVAKWFKSGNEKDIADLEKFCAENAVSFYNDQESWIYFSDLLKEVPIKVEDKTSFLKSTKNISFEDDEFVYFLTIYDYSLKDEVSPISFERDNIKARILNARTTEIVRKMRIELLNAAQTEIKNYVEK